MAIVKNELVMEMKTEVDEHSKNDAIERITSALEAVGAAEVGHKFWETILDEGGKMQMLQTKLGTLFGSKEVGKEVAEQIDEAGRNTLIDMGTLENFSKRMISLGLTTADGLRPMIEQFADLSNGSTEAFSQMSDAYTKLAIRGTVDSRSIMMFAQANGDIIKGLEKQFGISGSNAELQLRELADKGRITKQVMDDVLKSLTEGTGKYAGANKAIMSTMTGEWHMFGAETTNVLETLGTELAPRIASLLDYGVRFLRWYQDFDKGLNIVKVGISALTGVMTTFFISGTAGALGLNVALGGLPLIVGGIVTGLVLVLEYWDSIVDGFIDGWNYFIKMTTLFTGFIAEFITLYDKFMELRNQFGQFVRGEEVTKSNKTWNEQLIENRDLVTQTLTIEKGKTKEQDDQNKKYQESQANIRSINNLSNTTTNIMKKINNVTMTVAFNNSSETSKKGAERLLNTGMV